jgi:hypothetical protein
LIDWSLSATDFLFFIGFALFRNSKRTKDEKEVKKKSLQKNISEK